MVNNETEYNDLDDVFKPKTDKEARMIEKIKRNEKIYGRDFYKKPERDSLKILLYHIQRIKEGKSIRYDMENVHLSIEVVVAFCQREGINYRIGIKNGKEAILYIGGKQ